ncbi:3-deoxy-D-manno-octulosonic-acid transferase protein [Salinisphaera shabanensis E1L3A]|uniref:3-deoxy-D-manno-octulosonic-acid transferase protein n=1 Tax=Salinisphaera shabanensis E1L3A TaxID=1033802 RepID=U2EQ31_9GAMM|nr:lysophospholipid acyltransferase family protein [Salinisphaera shabanensis]ERJ20172.1 3-deoxy-D-manno-octulosonic-acid transferase protein [Salinisphaera shabanensis E1L3A]
MSQDSQSPPSWTTRLGMRIGLPLLRLVARALLASCRIQHVSGDGRLSESIDSGRALLLCCWHQRLSVSVGFLLQAKARGLRPGFLVSPSRDGEIVAGVVDGMGAHVIRGSATRTGARAMRDLYGVMKTGVSPIIHPDGPHGPAFIAKPGTLMLAQMTQATVLPMSFSADRYWQLGSWDRLIIPKPFARVVITIGEPLTVARGANIDEAARTLGTRLDELTRDADHQTGATPRPPRYLGTETENAPETDSANSD